ncbi:MAG: Fic family protein [Atopobiaceae bacterium]|nr:Fic family protein [Atopobiaceae bacterium]
MHRFDYRALADYLPTDIANITNVIFDLRARNEMRQVKNPSGFERLRESAVVESVRGSNAIEGIVTTKARLEELVSGAPPHTHGECEILGYKNALEEMYAPGFSADLSEDYVLHLHQLLLGTTSDQAGVYKRDNNWIQQRDADGRISVHFVPVSAADTPDAMKQLVMAYREARQDSRANQLVLVACVVVDFLCIHPFSDGNGRVSRLLTTMLLERAGFDICRYVSIEGMIDEHKAGYYDALEEASVGWHDNQSDYTPFVLYLLQILYACYRELDRRYVSGTLERVPKAKRVEALLMELYVPASKAEICDRLPEVGVRTVERVLSRLMKEGRVEKIGTYRDARYRRA